jgi:hypothetical protein
MSGIGRRVRATAAHVQAINVAIDQYAEVALGKSHRLCDDTPFVIDEL